MITGEQIINQFVRHWRQELFGLFTNEQLDVVEKAFISTDKQFFEVEGKKVTYIPGEKWNYEEQFGIELRAILEERGLSLTERQWKHIFGGKGPIFAPLAIPLKMLSTECYKAAYGKIPSQKSTDGVVKSLGRWNAKLKENRRETNDPFLLGYIHFLDDNREKIRHNPQENLAKLQAFLEEGGELSSNRAASNNRFYSVYQHYQERLKAGTYTDQEKEAAQAFVELFEKNWERQLHTPQENLADLKAFLEEGGELSTNRSTPGYRFYPIYRRYKKGFEASIYTEQTKKDVQSFLELFEGNWDRQIQQYTPQENLADLKAFLDKDGKLSSNRSTPNDRFYPVYRRYQKGLEAGTYTGQEKETVQAFVKLFEENWDRQILHTPSEKKAENFLPVRLLRVTGFTMHIGIIKKDWKEVSIPNKQKKPSKPL